MHRQAVKAVVNFLNQNPLSRAGKNFRNRLLDALFRSRDSDRGRAFAQQLPPGARDGLCVAIAFNTPWVIDILTAGWLRYSSGMTLLVADNSLDDKARQNIKAICDARGIPYLALPPNPEWSPNRSHGIAMNWVYYNVIRHLRPTVFGYIDHDCLPIAPIDIPSLMEGKSVHGLARSEDRPLGTKPWSLWAGYCFFRFSSVEALALDFKHRVEWLLDTGGGNWNVLFRHLAPEDVLEAKQRDLTLSFAGIEAIHEVFDDAVLHLGGASYFGNFNRSDYRKLLSDHIWDTYLGGRADRLLAP